LSADTVAILGAGPAGLTAAYLLAKAGVPVVVFEADPQYVGGISKTVSYRGYHFDIGGHRFFSKSQEVENLWSELLPDDMLIRPRSSRIYYRGRFFSYPLKAGEALLKLGIFESLRCGLSYLRARLFPVRSPRNFEEWVSNKFGSRLFQIFFQTYTEKVWGMPCKEISADWAAQRIKGLSLTTAVLAALFPKRRPRVGRKLVKTLIDSFRYPRRGPGMMWEACAGKVQAMGGTVHMGRKATQCRHDPATGRWTVTVRDGEGREHSIEAGHVISSAPVRELAAMLSPELTEAPAHAATQLKYRDFITVVLILKDRGVFADNWIYIHDPSVQVGRVQNFKSWSPEMVPDPATTCYGLEYFCFEHTGLWNLTDEELQELGRQEIVQLGLAKAEDLLDAHVVRQRKAYPVYDDAYATHLATIRAEIEARFPTLHLIGRNGMHKYNNQDHSMMTAMLCVKNILAGERVYDLWAVNEDAEYHESGEHGASVSGERHVPRALAPAVSGSA
jgi:protoporphyrinogen oxidase